MKLKDIKGLLPNKLKYNFKPKSNPNYPFCQSCNKIEEVCQCKGFNDCLDLLSEREIEAHECQVCGNDKHYKRFCKDCQGNGVIIKVKDGK